MKKPLYGKIKRRKNFLPALTLALISWVLWGWLIYSFAPTNSLLLITFYFLLFIAIFFTSGLIFASSRLGMLIGLWLILILIFRYFRIGNLLNLFLLTSIFLVLTVYFRKKE